MTKRSIATFSAIAAASFIGANAFAGTTTPSKAVKEVVKEESCITGDIGFDITSQYITRGLVQENQGAIVQPYFDLYFRLYEGSGALSKVSLNLGTWSSVHSHKHPASGSTTSAWYEFDYSVGATFEFGKLSVTPSLFTFLSPSDVFADSYNININVSYDDSDLLGAFALHPHAAVLFELEGKAGSGADEGVYYEFGIAPGFQAGPVSISLPITVGLGSHGFYGDPTGTGDDDLFGFVSAGIAAEYPITCIPECYGTWALKANVTYYHLGDNAALASVPAVNDGDDNQIVFGGGMVVRF